MPPILDSVWRLKTALDRNPPFCDPGMVCKSRFILKPYFLAHSTTRRMYLRLLVNMISRKHKTHTSNSFVRGKVHQATCRLPKTESEAGSNSIRHRLSPRYLAPSIMKGVRSKDQTGNETFYNEGLVVILKLVKASVRGVGGHIDGETPFVSGTRVLLEKCWGDEGFQDEQSTQIDTAMGSD